MPEIEIGRLLRAGISEYVIGCRVSQVSTPSLGALVTASVERGCRVFGVVADIRIEDDGLVRQLVTAEGLDENIIADNRINRVVPLEMRVLTVGFAQDGVIKHLLPPRPPLSLDMIHLCDGEEVRRFASTGRFGYLRHLLRVEDIPVGELLAAHLAYVDVYFRQGEDAEGSSAWLGAAVQELIILMRDDYATLMTVLNTIQEVYQPQIDADGHR